VPPITPFVKALLISLLALFVAGAILQNFVGVPIVAMLVLTPIPLSPLTALQVFTHVLIEPPSEHSTWQLPISLLFLWLCLAPIEAHWGKARAIQLCLVAAVTGAAAAVLVGLVLPRFAGPLAGPGTMTLAAISAWVGTQGPHAVGGFGNTRFPVHYVLWFNLGLVFIGFLVSGNAANFAADLAAAGGGYLFARKVLLAPQRAPSRKRTSSSRLRLVKNDDDDDEPKHWLN
jgi:membrane associated rhomboid family serine protease